MPNNPRQNDHDVTIEWSNFVKFLRQLSHDLRNHLNAVELQTAFLNEIAENAEIKDEIKRLREMVGEVSRSLQKVISKVVPINPTRIKYRCCDLIDDVKQKLASTGGESKIEWSIELGDETFEIDPQLLLEAILELLDNASRQQSSSGPAIAAAKIADGKFEFTLREPTKDFDGKPENWGRDPLHTVGRGHYGLGLNRARMIAEAHGGNFSASYDPQSSTLTSRIVVPLQASG